MAKRCKENCPQGPNNAYLISFGDTMTALLAFFIVLNSLAEEQTGANLHAGTGSFMKSVDKFGLAGKVSSDLSAKAFQQNAIAPKYIVADPEDRPAERGAKGPDDEDDNERIVDRAKDEYHRFLQQLREVNNLEQERDITGEVSFDVMSGLSSGESLLNDELKAALNGVAPMLRRDDYAMEITVWAKSPAIPSWTRAVRTAERLHREVAQYLRLFPNQRPRVTAVGRTWISQTVKRPIVSVTLRRLK